MLDGDGRDEILPVRGSRVVVYGGDRPPASPKRLGTLKWMNMSLPALGPKTAGKASGVMEPGWPVESPNRSAPRCW